MYEIYDLRTNGIKEPIGIDGNQIALSWKLSTDKKNVFQKEYCVNIKQSGKLIYTTGSICSKATKGIIVDSAVLESGNLYEWNVESVSADGAVAQSESSIFFTGKINGDSFNGKWVEDTFERKPIDDVCDAMLIFTNQIEFP